MVEVGSLSISTSKTRVNLPEFYKIFKVLFHIPLKLLEKNIKTIPKAAENMKDPPSVEDCFILHR